MCNRHAKMKCNPWLLEPSAWCAFLACEQTVLHSECPVYNPRRFSGIPSRKPKSSPFLRWCKLSWAPTRLPLWSWPLRRWRWRRCWRVSPWLSVIPPSSLAIDIAIEVFSSFELLILSFTLLMLWTYWYQRLLRFRQASTLHLKKTSDTIVSFFIFLLHKVFLSFLIRQKRELTLRESFCPSFCTNVPKIRRC